MARSTKRYVLKSRKISRGRKSTTKRKPRKKRKASAWALAFKAARKKLEITGFEPIKSGSELHRVTWQIYSKKTGKPSPYAGGKKVSKKRKSRKKSRKSRK